jgi:DNA primase
LSGKYIRRGLPGEAESRPRERASRAMSATAKILDRLQGVKQTASDRWIARCPAHEDKSPSLSIRDNGGKVLLHCFGGCETGDVLDAIGLELSDLFDQPLEHFAAATRSRIPARDALETLAHETFVALTIASDFLQSRKVDEAGFERLAQACGRISGARAACGGR